MGLATQALKAWDEAERHAEEKQERDRQQRAWNLNDNATKALLKLGATEDEASAAIANMEFSRNCEYGKCIVPLDDMLDLHLSVAVSMSSTRTDVLLNQAAKDKLANAGMRKGDIASLSGADYEPAMIHPAQLGSKIRRVRGLIDEVMPSD